MKNKNIEGGVFCQLNLISKKGPDAKMRKNAKNYQTSKKEILACFAHSAFYKIHISGAANRHIPVQYAKYVVCFSFYAPPQEVAGYYVIPSELLSVCPSVRPSAVDHSCPLYNFDTVQDNFTKLGTNVKHDQTTCRD